MKPHMEIRGTCKVRVCRRVYRADQVVKPRAWMTTIMNSDVGVVQALSRLSGSLAVLVGDLDAIAQ